jgi:hypothetical protein
MKIHTWQWILKISRKKSSNQKSRDICQIFVISKKKARTSGKKSIGLALDLKKSIENLRPSLCIFIVYDFHFWVQLRVTTGCVLWGK